MTADPCREARESLQRTCDALIAERDRLQDDLSAARAELEQTRRELEDMANAVRFLAKQEATTFGIRATAIRMLAKGEVEEAKDLVIMKWPIVQGLRNQIDLESVGKQSCDLKRVRPAIDALLRAALANHGEAQCQKSKS